MPRLPRLALVLAALGTLAACASGGGSSVGETAGGASRSRPLGSLVGAERVVVLPTRYLDVDPDVRWWTSDADSARALADLDDDLRFALEERGVGGGWVWPDAVRRSAARSGGALPDPSTWDAWRLARDVRAGEAIAVPESVRSHLRTVGALHGARYVLYPLRYGVARRPADGGVPGALESTLRIGVIDVRTATVDWIGYAKGAPAARFGAAVPASIASSVADLVSARP